MALPEQITGRSDLVIGPRTASCGHLTAKCIRGFKLRDDCGLPLREAPRSAQRGSRRAGAEWYIHLQPRVREFLEGNLWVLSD